MLKFQNKKLANKAFNSAVEVPYFTAKCFVNVCFRCGGVDRLKIEEGSYPVCGSCAEKSEN
jgi:hypothetical protein